MNWNKYHIHIVLSTEYSKWNLSSNSPVISVVFRMSCPVALPHGDMGCSAVCDCGISWSYPLAFSRFFQFKCIRKQTCPWCQVGQGQPRIIIWTNLIGPTSQMLHTKSIGFWRIFLKGFYHIARLPNARMLNILLNIKNNCSMKKIKKLGNVMQQPMDFCV